MNDDIYEVSRDEYAGFIGGLNKKECEVEQVFNENETILKIKSKLRDIPLCTRIIPQNDVEKYYIYNMPSKEESVPNKPVLQIKLETREEVQAFFDALSKLQREEHKND